MRQENEQNGSNDYVIRVFDDPAQIDPAQWNALLAAQPSATPFMRHEYLLALHESGSASPAAGWTAQFIGVFASEGGVEALVAASALYLKDHSYGEYVFDWAWADAYRRHGLDYYPKLLGAVPFTPGPGPRLLARDDRLRVVLLNAIQALVRNAGLSSAHLLFLDEADQRVAREAGWMMRSTVQFHWTNREPARYADFADFLASLQREKRKKIGQERRKVAEAGVSFTARSGTDIAPGDWDFFYRCYTLTYRAHHSTPYLTRDFFARMAAAMPEHWLLFIAEREGHRIAASLIAIDPARGNAFGRYWGASEDVAFLHFNVCFYQGIRDCLSRGLEAFEPGAGGEHKLPRGFHPTLTYSAHSLENPRLKSLLDTHLTRERAAILSRIARPDPTVWHPDD